jgi:hypothetical protein
MPRINPGFARSLILVGLFVATWFPLCAADYDLVVYGGTAGGVMTAVSAARQGLSVALVEPGAHIGGMVTGGLSATDHGRKSVVGGMAREFYTRVGQQYGQPINWYPEPKIAGRVLREMLDETRVRVFLRHRLKERGGVLRDGGKIRSIATEDGAEFRAAVFADATYEGDLMAQSGVSYTLGRESTREYGESLAGVRPKDRGHQFDVRVAAYDAPGRLFPEIQKEPRGEIGSGDRRIQAYNFRLVLTRDRNNQAPFPKPPDYDPVRFQLFVRLLQALTAEKGRPPRLGEVVSPVPISGGKADFNNNGAFSTDYIGKNYDYPDGSYRRRAEIRKDHVNYTQGFFYFLMHDAGVPESLRSEAKVWGLPKDEFVDEGNWPYQLYIREARRMVGDFVMTQKDIQTELTKPDVIGMGSYNSDSHNVQRFVQPDGTVQNEGNMEVPVRPYHVPYRVIVPKRSQAVNLLVPVCFSASHVTYSTMRMEPVYMIVGQAAGVAASLAVREKKPVQDIDPQSLSAILRKGGMVDRYQPGDDED